MTKFLKGLALLAALTSVVWIAVIWRWRSTPGDRGAGDLLLYLVVLPLVVFVLVLAARWAVRGALARQAALAAATAAATAAPQPGGAGAGERERGLCWALLGAWGAGPAGGDMPAVMAAAKAGTPGPAPDAELRDEHGLPVMCARTPSLDTAPVDEAWVQWRQSPNVPVDAARPPAHVMRALAALEPLLQAAGPTLQAWAGATASAARRPARVRVLAAWPEGWREPEQAWATAWLRMQWPGVAPGAIDADRWLLQPLPPGSSGPEAWQAADGLLLALERERCDDAVLLLACHSELGEAAVQAWERQGHLFCAAQRPKGRMPGEGAAVLLLARPGEPGLPDPREPVAWLHRPVCLRRDKPIDAPGRTTADVARQAVAQAFTAAGAGAAEAAALCSDADRHSPRATELFATTIDLLPDLDPVEDMCLMGAVQGHAGHTGALWAVAGAAAQALAHERPALALSLADGHWRMALIARHQPRFDPVASSATPSPTS